MLFLQVATMEKFLDKYSAWISIARYDIFYVRLHSVGEYVCGTGTQCNDANQNIVQD